MRDWELRYLFFSEWVFWVTNEYPPGPLLNPSYLIQLRLAACYFLSFL